MTGSVRGELRRALGEDVVFDPGGGWPAGIDPADCVVLPRSSDQVAAVLALASAEGWRVAPLGAGTWPECFEAAHGRPTVAVSTRCLDRVVDHSPADMTVTVEAGARLATIRRALAAERQWLPLDPPYDDDGTIGATLATASAGPLETEFGAPRDLTLGLELCTGDGAMLTLGGRVVKNVAGFDLVRLAVGSWGALGVVTRATLRVLPLPEVDLTLLLAEPRSQDLVGAARSIATGPVSVASLQLAESSDSPGTATLAARVVGSAPEVSGAVALVQEATARADWRTAEPGEARTLDRRWRSAGADAALGVRLSFLPAKLEVGHGLLDAFRAELARELPSAKTTSIADVLTGRIRVAVWLQGQVDAGLLGRILAGTRELLEREGGSLTLEKAAPDLYREIGAWGDPGPAGAIAREIVRRFDPAGILPSGRFTSGAASAALAGGP